MRCEELSDDLAAAADGSVLLSGDQRRHVERCLRCQAELVQYRKLLRALRAMRTETVARLRDGGEKSASELKRGDVGLSCTASSLVRPLRMRCVSWRACGDASMSLWWG